MTEVQDTFDIGRNRRQAKQHHATSSTTTSGAFSPTAGGSSSSTAAAAGRADGNSPIGSDTSPSQSSSHSPPPAAAVAASSTSNGLVAPHPNHVVSAGGLGGGAPTRGFRVPAQRRMQQQQGGDSSEDDEDEGHAGNGNGLVSDVSEVYQFGGDEAFDAIIEQPNPKNVAWRCGSCGYCMLAIDHRGAPLPLTRDAFGRVIPMQCPKCMLRHAQWTPCEPFRNNGDHVNVKSTFSNTVRAAYEAPLVRQSSALGLTTATTAATTVVPVTGSVGTAASSIGANSSATSTAAALPAILASIGAVTYREGVAVPTAAAAPAPRAVRQTYICGLCQRKLLRIDQFGALVPLDLDTAGNVAPLRCPGCKQIHSDWPIKSM